MAYTISQIRYMVFMTSQSVRSFRANVSRWSGTLVWFLAWLTRKGSSKALVVENEKEEAGNISMPVGI